VACTRADVQAGFHVIGDAAADALLTGLAAAARQVDSGRLVAGAPASYAVWDGAGPLDGHPDTPRCLRTVHKGVTLFDALMDGVARFPP
jgi:predicted amidohydrolase YtcJ